MSAGSNHRPFMGSIAHSALLPLAAVVRGSDRRGFVSQSAIAIHRKRGANRNSMEKHELSLHMVPI